MAAVKALSKTVRWLYIGTKRPPIRVMQNAEYALGSFYENGIGHREGLWQSEERGTRRPPIRGTQTLKPV